MKRNMFFAVFGIFLSWLWKKNNTITQPKSLKNCVTIITGGASGIGKATAHAFARHGAIVIIGDLEHQLTDDVKQPFTAYSTDIHFIACDITQDSNRQLLVNTILQQYDRIDILINNAGVSKGGAFAEIDTREIDKLIDVNLRATLHLTHRVLNIMKQQNSGHIVNISSVNAVMPPPGEAIYSATKAGVNAFTASIRRELGKSPIKLSVVMPALTRTDMLNNVTEGELRKNQLLMPGMPLDTAENVADGILYAVKYQQNEVICGGNVTRLLARIAPIQPSAMDWVFRYVINTEKFMKALKELGNSELNEES